jgi:hypothetical protein
MTHILLFVLLSLHRASEEGLRKLQSMEEAFTKLKQVTGVKNVEEMHEKFSTQKSNKLQLELEVKDAEHRLATAKKLNQRVEQQFQELKSSGLGLAELNRDNINRLEELYTEARNDQKSIKADADRISTVLVSSTRSCVFSTRCLTLFYYVLCVSLVSYSWDYIKVHKVYCNVFNRISSSPMVGSLS